MSESGVRRLRRSDRLLPAPCFLITFLFLAALFFDPAPRFLFCFRIGLLLFELLLFLDSPARRLVRCRIPIALLLSDECAHGFFPFSFVVDSSAAGAGRESTIAVALQRVPCVLKTRHELPREFTVSFSLHASCSFSGN